MRYFFDIVTWELRKLGEVSDIVRGSSPRPISDSKWFDTNSKVGWLRISDVTSQQGRIKKLDQHLSKLGEEKTRVLLSPHLLLSIAASVGYPVINYVPTGVHDGFLIFKNPKFQLNYGFYWLQNNKNKWQKYGQPGSQVNLNSSIVENAKIFLPNNNEQSKIIALLLRIDKMLALQQRKLNILNQLKKTYLSEMYSLEKLDNLKLRFSGFTTAWKEYQIRQLGKVITGSTPSTKHSEYYSKDGIPWVTPTDIRQNITYTTSRKLSKKGQKVARIVPQNTILVTCIASIGKNTILGKTGSFNQQINGLIPDFKNYDLYFLFTQTRFWSLRMKHSASTGTMQIVNKKDFENIKTLVPSIAEQKKIGNFFLQLDNYISNHKKKISTFKQIKNYLLQNMFI